MIIDTLTNASKYTGLHPLFAQAFDYIKQNDIANLPDGTSVIAEGLKVIVNTAYFIRSVNGFFFIVF